jgi:rhodanese-related sulfurtransferase
MVQIVTREQLKAKMDRGDVFKLVMAMDQWHFDACRIPGSVLLSDKRDAPKLLRQDEEIVVYCSDDACFASRAAADYLERTGYDKVSHYPGGLLDWGAAGYPMEGTMISSPAR